MTEESKKNPTRVRLVVGLWVGEDTYPSIAGAIDEITWEIIPPEDWDRIRRDMCQKFSPDWTNYEWREVVVEVATEPLLSMFGPETLEAKIVLTSS